MRGLFFKIFGILWLAQSLVFVITTFLIVRQHFPNRNVAGDALDSNLRYNATLALADYQAGGCTAFASSTTRNEPHGATLLTAEGKPLCSTAGAVPLTNLDLHFPNRIDGQPLNGTFVWLIPVQGKDLKQYEYVWFQPAPAGRTGHVRQFSWTHDLLHFAFPQLPVAIAVLGVATFILVLLFTRPVARLRRAARELASGNLTARVPESSLPHQNHTDEFKALNHDFNHMAERLESLVGAQKLLLRDVSHELRSPLARLSVALELAREDANPELDQHLTRIERETERLNLLIGQLLTLSSMEATERTSAFEPLSLNDLCEQLLPDAEYEAQRRPCTVALQEDSQVSIRGNSELLYRAIENVVRNAIRYTAKGSEVTLRVAETHVDTQRFALLEITDFGPGIPESDLEHIFRPFYRVDESRTTSTGGFGVGLAITERAVRLHGGILRATNRPEGGTAIQMKFPLS